MMAKPIGFTATATPTLDYLHHDKGGALTAERVEWAENVNCIQASPEETERMWAQLVADAPELKRQAGGSSRGRRLEKPFAQYLFSWHPDENPSRSHILDTVKDGMKKLGYGRCQYRVVVHRDTDHVHAHVIVCRVHPEAGRAMGRKNDGDRLREWSLDYEKAQGRIRVPGRLEDLAHRRRHSADKRADRQPPAASPDVNRRRRERRRRRRTTRDAIGRPIVLNEKERREWGTLLRANPTRGQKAALKRQQTATRLEDQRQRAARLEAAASRRPAPPPVAIAPRPERPRQDLTYVHVEAPAAAAVPAPVELAPRPERPRADLAYVHVEAPAAAAVPAPVELAPRPERPRADLAYVHVEAPAAAAVPAPVAFAPKPERPRVDVDQARTDLERAEAEHRERAAAERAAADHREREWAAAVAAELQRQFPVAAAATDQQPQEHPPKEINVERTSDARADTDRTPAPQTQEPRQDNRTP